MGNETAKPAGQQSRRATIGLASAIDAATALETAMDALPPADRLLGDQQTLAIVLPRGWNDEIARAAVEWTRTKLAAGSSTPPTLLFRTPGAVGQAASTFRERWIETALGSGAERFDRVRVPARVLEATRVVLAPAGGGELPAMRPIAIAAAFAHPRQRAAARLEADPAAMAELAAPLAPRLTLALARLGERWLAAASADPVAAELAWLGLAALTSRRGELVAWQDPGVQRLDLLGSFVQSPDDIDVAPDSSVDSAVVRAFAEELGVTLPAAPNPGQK